MGAQQPAPAPSMHPLKTRLAGALAGLFLLPLASRADDWTTVAYDAQRSSWVRADAKISPATVRGPDFRLLWTMPLAGSDALTAPALLDFLISHRGFRSLAFIGGSGGSVFAVDTDLARHEWERQFPNGSPAASPECPGGMTANVTRATSSAMPSMLGFGARGRRSPAASGVGAPGEGAVTLANLAARPRASSPASTSGRTRPPAQRSLRGLSLVYALSADGMLHALYASNGRDHAAPVPFVPANAKAQGLIVVDNVAYATTSDGCGGAADGVWAVELGTGQVASWASDGGAIAGPTGVAIGPDATVYAATREGPLVALEAASLRRKAASDPIGFRSAPVVFDRDGADHLAALAQDGTLLVFEAADLDTVVANGFASASPDGSEHALAAWRDSGGGHWILAPAADSVVAWKLTERGGTTRLEQGWESPKLSHPLPPIIVNGVAFVLDGGGSSVSAKLHALDGTTGKPLWDSGSAIQANARGHALAAGPGHVFLTAADGTAYAFGFPMEH